MRPMSIKDLNSWMKKFLNNTSDLLRVYVEFNKPPNSLNDFGIRVKSDYG